ncbi:acyl-CoA-binding protein [Tricharina praecox]|uniref:acyl-CoA-binding protein n=1 Tax=Tricharina praecox TaxID=43433 RepID=UPI00221F8363|nr:acyl-CoA-binding protein [Tricharina praecox]KAI5841637.1 acyl-CoA-binding protein [Tricharina praecox]
MPSGSPEFQQACADVKTLGSKPKDVVQLELYALFKRVTVGDVTGKEPKPGFTDFEGKAKLAARQKIAGMSEQDAEKAYIDLVKNLLSA